MSTKIKKDDLRNKFRPRLFVQNIHQLENYDPAYEYKNVIFTYRHDPGRVQRYLENGWEIVESTEHTVDDRSFTPNSKEDNLRPQPVTSTTRDGLEQVLMRCLKTRREDNEAKKRQTREDLMDQQARRRGGRIERKGNEIITREAEINENNVNTH